MPAFVRDNGAWSEGIMRVRNGSTWTADDDAGFARDGSEWVQFQPEPTELLPPENVVASNIQAQGATFTWTNPDQDPLPTQVQYRVPEITTVWTELEYPATTTIATFLAPETEYQFQVRYIIREDGLITTFSSTVSVFFTTPALSGPGTPAPDPMGTGPDAIIPWGDTNNPGPVGSEFCWWEYVIQQFSYASGFTDTAVTAEVAGDIGALAFNFIDEGFACADVLRWKYREVCDSVPGEWQYASAFEVICDYTEDCGGAAQTADFSSNALYSDPDVVFAMPKMCWNSDTFKNEIIDFVAAGTEYGKLSAFRVPLYIDSAWGLYATSGISEYGEPLAAGHVPGLVPIGSPVPELTSDFSFTTDVLLDIVPQAGSGAPVKLLEIGKTLKLYAYANGGSWRVTASVPKEGGGSFSLTSTTDLTTDEWHKITVTIDQDGDKILYIDGVADTTDSDTTRANFGDMKGDVELYMNDNGAHRKVAGWGRVLTPTEINSLLGAPYPYYVSESAELIPAASTSFTHTLPSGISAGDMIMVLWRTNDSGSTKTWGATPAGWTAGAEQYATKLYYKIADGTETDMTLTWTGGSGNVGANQGIVHSLLYRNVDPLEPFLVEPAVLASSGGSSSFWDSPGVDPATSDSVSGSPTNLDNFTSFMEGTSFVGVVSSDNVGLIVSASTTYQPNIAEIPTTLGSRYLRSWSHDGITENSGLYNDQSARWTHGSGWNNGFAAILRAPRTDEWLAKTHVAYRHTTRLDTGFDSNLAATAEVAHLDGMLAMVVAANGSAVSPTQIIDTTAGVSTWMTPLNGNCIYYGTWAAAGRQARAAVAGGPIVTCFIIANANTSDPVSVNMTRSYNSQTFGEAAYFWTRTDQLIIGHFRTANLDTSFWTYGASDLMSVEHRDWQWNTSAGNQTAQVVYGRGLVDGYGFLPALTPNSTSQNNLAWFGINHSSESSPALATPTIVGSPTVQTRTATSGTFTITKPSGTQVGEILVMLVHLQSGGEIQSTNPPDGFEPIDQQVSGGSGVGIFEVWMKVVDGTEPASWSPAVNGAGAIIMQRVTGILPMRGHPFWQDSGTIANPQPFGTPELFKPGIVLRSGAYQDGTARAVAVSVGTDIVADLDTPPLSTSTTHWNVKGEVIATSTPGAANYTLTPFPGAPSTARGSIYHLAAGPA